ncbi:MAG: STAS domain-containing protein [Patescibacteria group bacterium]|nr:STAS domain-containing protein [Patescibacteria group bacterium]
MVESDKTIPLEIQTQEVGGIPCIKLAGECDIATAKFLGREIDNLISRGARKIIIDLTEVRYIDSSGYRILVNARMRLGHEPNNLALVVNTKPFERVLKLLQLDRLMVLTDSIDQAIALL